MGTWWEPAAALTCTTLFTASGELHKPCDIFKISEIKEPKLPKGLLPRPGTLSCSTPSFLWDSSRTRTKRDARSGGGRVSTPHTPAIA